MLMVYASLIESNPRRFKGRRGWSPRVAPHGVCVNLQWYYWCWP